MADFTRRDTGHEAIPPREGSVEDQPVILPIRPQIPATRTSVHTVLSPQYIDRKLELQRRRDACELSLSAFDPARLWWLNGGDDEAAEPKALTRSMLMHSKGEQAVVLTFEERNIVRRLTCIDCHGRRICLALEDILENELLIIFPEELGDTEGKPSLRVIG
ncbi:MAG: hypothetical protein PHX87_06660 [Candidatus Peribacteraceae bacterium]|nr:hypothetical protein [Candidatus Peribacteraceae bacterium]